MKTGLYWKRLLMGCLLLALLTGCAAAVPETPTPEPTDTLVPPTSSPIAPAATPAPSTETPEPTSCEEVEGDCLEISFDGVNCTLEGPTTIYTETVTVLFFNESESDAAVELIEPTGGKTIQDLIDDIRERPAEPAPSWVSLWGMWRTVRPGEMLSRSRVIRRGAYGVVCGRVSPHHVYYGGVVRVDW